MDWFRVSQSSCSRYFALQNNNPWTFHKTECWFCQNAICSCNDFLSKGFIMEFFFKKLNVHGMIVYMEIPENGYAFSLNRSISLLNSIWLLLAPVFKLGLIRWFFQCWGNTFTFLKGFVYLLACKWDKGPYRHGTVHILFTLSCNESWLH